MRLSLVIPIFVFLSSVIFSEQLDVRIETPYAILINAETGKVLFEKRAKAMIYPASTTKVATLLYTLKTVPDALEDSIECPKIALEMTSEAAKKAENYSQPAYFLEPDGTSMHLRLREVLSLKDLLYGTMLVSANDAANTIAYYVCRDIATFVKRMNEMAEELGCENTHFCNPHGLHHPEHMSCAYDIALLTKEAWKYPLFRQIVGTSFYERPKTNLQSPMTYRNSHLFLHEDRQFYYPKALGGKTGYTKKAKHNLVSVASDGERTLIAVLHKSPSKKQRYNDTMLLFETAFKEKKETRLLFRYEETLFQTIIPKAKTKLIALLDSDVDLEYYPSEEEEIRTQIIWKKRNLPIESGEYVADIMVFGEEERLLKTVPLYAKDRVQMRLFFSLVQFLHDFLENYLFGLVFLGLIGITIKKFARFPFIKS